MVKYMKKRMLNKANKLAMSPDRLDNNIEAYPLEWLFSDRKAYGYPSELDKIKNAILCMDKSHGNYHHLIDDKKPVVDKLLENEDVVDIVLVTLFQWFGTNVGKHEIGKLMDEIRNMQYEPESINMLIRDEDL